MKSKWVYFDPINPEKIDAMIERLRMPRPVVRVLHNRGLVEYEKITEFLNPDTNLLHDPFLLKDMEPAVDRIITALREREEILVFGDYDVDGITSVSALYLFLKDLCGQVSYYIPDRSTEGYGISTAGIEEAQKKGASLIISVDCGITSVNEVEFARKHGIDIIISDHHEQGETLPDAVAVLDPKRADCGYPFKELAGVGVAYKLAQGIVKKLELDKAYAEKYLDLVAIGSAADIVPLIDENRIFVRVGLDRLNRDGHEGILTLIETAGYQPGRVDVGQIIYGLAPRINAVGRLGRATPAVELLVTKNHMNAQRIASELEEKNRQRKEIDNKTLLEAMDKIHSFFNPEQDSVVVLSGEGWHSGVIGIVASRIIEKYYKPTIMIAVENGVGKGSARSIPNFDLYGALKSCSDLLIQFGGHKYAAGLTIKADKIPEFRKRFNEVASKILTEDDVVPKIRIDDELRLDEINTDLIRMLEGIAPFGPKNNKPCFVSYGLEVVGYPRIVGKNHLKFKVRQNGVVIDTIAFNRGEDLPHLQNNRYIDMIYYVDENHWMNRTTIQLKVKDFR